MTVADKPRLTHAHVTELLRDMVRIRRFDMAMIGLSIAGPKSREVLQCLTDAKDGEME